MLARVRGQPADHGRRVRPEAVLWGGPGPCSGLQQVSSRELVCRSCLKTTLHKLEGMMRILQAETTEGTVTPTTIADSILNITGVGPCLLPPPQPPAACARCPNLLFPPAGDLIHLASSDVQGLQPSELGAEPPSLMVASKAYNLSSALMRILMRSRVLNEEPLTLAGEEIVAQGKRSDPLSLLCYGNASGPGCHFSIPEAFSGALSNLSDVVQLIFLVDSNPFPFGYISNYTVSTKVASMAFQTQAGAQIPIERLATERAITVKVPNNSDQAAQGPHAPAGSAIVQPQASVSAVVTPDSSSPEAGLHLQVTYVVLSGGYRGQYVVQPPFLPALSLGKRHSHTVVAVQVCLPLRGARWRASGAVEKHRLLQCGGSYRSLLRRAPMLCGRRPQRVSLGGQASWMGIQCRAHHPQSTTCLRSLSPTWQPTCTRCLNPTNTTAQPGGGSAWRCSRVLTTGPTPSS